MPMAADKILRFAAKAIDHFAFIGAAVSHIDFAFSPVIKNDVIRKKSVSIYLN
jgi:hypothetical protein|tara:strand:+ start:35 stop:193 length:159 start_codon:yes stop_codon:yes gene_type:complete